MFIIYFITFNFPEYYYGALKCNQILSDSKKIDIYAYNNDDINIKF